MTNEIYVLKNYGKIKICLKEPLSNKNFSRNQLATYAQVSPDLVSRYYKNNVTRVDLDILARFCKILECDITDILIYETDVETGSNEE